MQLSLLNQQIIPIDEITAKANKKYNNNNRRKNLAIFPDEEQKRIKIVYNDFGEKITRIDGDIPSNLEIKNGDRYLFISYDQSALTHGFHKYPAKFFPELPRWFIKRYSNEYDLILDPFSGSGTTNVEALLNKRHSIGIDVDPFSRFLSKVKATPVDVDELYKSKEVIIGKILKYHPDLVSIEDVPDFPYRDNWFNREILLELAYLKKCIMSIDTPMDIKNFYLVCFSSVIRSVSNADNNCTRTVIRKKLGKKVYPTDALKAFAKSMLMNIHKLDDFSQICPKDTNVDFPSDSDARNIKYNDNVFDLAATSPPYVNAVDYPRTHQLEIYWLGIETGSLLPLKRKYVGHESVRINEYNKLSLIGVNEADKAISEIYTKDRRRAYIAYNYLADMKKNLKEVYRVLKPGGRYIVVVGNNKIRGVVFENWKHIMTLAEEIGFEIENYFGSEIINHFIKVPREERIDTDWVLVLRKP